MTPQQVYTMLTSIDDDIPVAYYRFLDTAEQPAPAPPFLCYYYPSGADFYADNSNYQIVSDLIVELYTDFKDFTLEERVESVLNANELTWEKEETYIDDQRMHMTIWTTEVVQTSNGGTLNG